MDLPKTIQVGDTELVELSFLQNLFGISRVLARRYLSAFRIHPLYIGKETYFSMSTFNRILFVLSRPGAKGFVFPGSNGRKNDKLRQDENYLNEVTDEIIELAQSPQILAEMAVACGHNDSMLKKLIAQDTAKIRKGNNG